MMSTLKRLKFLHGLYNIWNCNKLRHQASLYKKFGLKKKYFSSISSKDLPDDSIADHPWLDLEDSVQVLPCNSNYLKLNPDHQKALVDWSNDGFALIKNFYSEEKVARMNHLIQSLLHENHLEVKEKRKIMHAVKVSSEMNTLVNTAELKHILNLIMGREMVLYQSINFLKGSEDPAHSDFIHMSTYPYGYLIAVWIALEEITLDNGPLFYYPGSHKLPYTMNKDFNHGGNSWLIGKHYKRRYAEKIQSVIKEAKLEKKIFTAAKGDILIWHANMLHGGSPIVDDHITRKSMVLHYFGRDVIKYHEVSERPSLLKEY